MNELTSHAFIDIFTRDGKLIEHLPFPGLTRGGCIDEDGFLYLIKEEDGYYRIVKYSLYLGESVFPEQCSLCNGAI
jgi:hypothetical protein